MSPAPAAARGARRPVAAAPRRALRSVAPARRISGPSRREIPPTPTPGPLAAPLSKVLRALARVSRHPLVDRLVRGRWSIAIVAFALIGIVTLQLGLLKLNAGVGRSLERERALERQNASLALENTELASSERIRRLAAHLGMSPVALTSLRFLTATHDAHASARAAAALRTPVHTEAESAEGEASSRAATGSEGEATGASTATGSEGEASSASTATSSESEASPAPGAGAEAGGGEAGAGG